MARPKLVKLDEGDGDVIGQVARMTHIAGGEKRVRTNTMRCNTQSSLKNWNNFVEVFHSFVGPF